MHKQRGFMSQLGAKKGFVVIVAMSTVLLILIGCAPLLSRGEREPTVPINAIEFSSTLAKQPQEAAFSRSAKIYLGQPAIFSGIKTSSPTIWGPNQVTSFGDAFSPSDSPYREEMGHDGTFTYEIEIPVNYQGTVFDALSNSYQATNIVRVELLDPDSYNRLVPEDAYLTHSQLFVTELLNNGASISDLVQSISEADCSGSNLLNPCIIQTCEWAEHAGQGRCHGSVYSNYYNSNANPYSLEQVNPHWFGRIDESGRTH